MRTITAVKIYAFHRCARCGKEEDPEEITRKLETPILIGDEKARITVEVLCDNEVNQS